MASITASSGKASAAIANNLEEWVIKLLNEIRRLRMGDTSEGESEVL